MAEDTQARTAPTPVGNGAYEAKQGECIYSIAARTGHRWQTLWDHPQNRDLREVRKDPGILLPGDRVFIPELGRKIIPLESGKRHRIVIDGQVVWLRLRMCDPDGEPLANAQYELWIGDQKLPCTTNADGYFEARVPVLAETVRLCEVATGESLTLRLGHMDPQGTAGAVRKRLANLGYHPGGAEAEMTAELDEHSDVLLDDFREDAALDGESDWEVVLRQLEGREPWST